MELKSIGVVFFFVFSSVLAGQSKSEETEGYTEKEGPEKKGFTFFDKKANVRVLLVGDYASSLTEDVDMDGVHNPDNSTNGFYLRYARINGKFNINKQLMIQVLVNLADFKKDPETKVLEIAALKWKINPYLNMQLGQFRPYFGLEDRYGFDVHKSYTWSKQYSLMGKSNWQSFQIGAALYGSLAEKGIPLNYFYTVYNGNGKNRQQDNDDAKNHAVRFEYDVFKDLRLGINTSFAKVEKQNATIYGVDVKFAQKLSDKWRFEINAEYKTGTNVYAFKADDTAGKDIGDFNMKGYYIIPSITRLINAELNSYVEFSMRYECLDELANGNTGQFFNPMISYGMGKDNWSKISLVGVLSNYDENVEGTSKYDSNLMLIQYQLKF